MKRKTIISTLPNLSRDEMGQLRGGFSVYEADPTTPIKTSVTVAVYGKCGCDCSVLISK